MSRRRATPDPEVPDPAAAGPQARSPQAPGLQSLETTLAAVRRGHADSTPGNVGVTDAVMQEILAGFRTGLERDQSAAVDAMTALPADEVEAWFSRVIAAADLDEIPEIARLAARASGIEFGGDLTRAVLGLPDSPARAILLKDLGGSDAVRRHLGRLHTADRHDQRLLGLELAAAVGDDAAIEQALADPSADVRLAALELAVARSVDRFGPRLADLTVEDPAPAVRAAAARSIARASRPVRLDAARRALGGSDVRVRSLVVGLLGDDGVEEVMLLDHALDDDAVEVVGAAARLLAAAHPSEAPSLLWRALVHHDRAHRSVLIAAMDELEPASLTPTLHRAMQSDDAAERALGLQVGARHDLSDRMTAMLHEALTDPSIEVRLHAFEALGERNDVIDIRVVGERVQDPAPAVRLEAVRLLRSLSDDRCLEMLLVAAGDPADHIKTVARAALLDRRSPSLVDDLLRALAVPSRRRTARDLLMELDEDALEPMLDALGDADEAVRAEIGVVLRGGGHTDELTRRLSSRDPNVRRGALAGLTVAADPGCVPAVANCLGDPVPAVRRLAIGVLEALGDARAIEPLRQALVSDPDLELVPAIEQALRALGADDLDDHIIELRPPSTVEP